MNATRCYFEVYEGILFEKKVAEYELFILNDFKSEAEPLLRLTFADKKKNLIKSLTYEADYLYLRVLDNDEDLNFGRDDELSDDFWFVPDYCVEQSEECGRSKEVRLPGIYELTLRKIEREQSKTFSLIAGNESRLIGLSGSNAQSVLDLANGLQYELLRPTGGCHKFFNGQYRGLEPYADLLEIMHKLKQLSASDYVGLRSCREMNCDAYSFYSSPDSLEEILWSGGQGNGSKTPLCGPNKKKEEDKANDNDVKPEDSSFGPTLYTFYLREDGSTGIQHLVQVKKQLFAQRTNNVRF